MAKHTVLSDDAVLSFGFSKSALDLMESWIDDGYFRNSEEIVTTAFDMLTVAIKEVELKKGTPMHVGQLEFDITLKGTHPQ